MVNNSVVFPYNLTPGSKVNTTDLIITPFMFRNDGNVFANLTNTSINQSMWSAVGAGLGTRYMQIMAGNTSQSGAFNKSISTMNWINASGVNNNTIMMLNYSNVSNTAYMHVLIEVPLESPGNKATFITFNWIGSN